MHQVGKLNAEINEFLRDSRHTPFKNGSSDTPKNGSNDTPKNGSNDTPKKRPESALQQVLFHTMY